MRRGYVGDEVPDGEKDTAAPSLGNGQFYEQSVAMDRNVETRVMDDAREVTEDVWAGFLCFREEHVGGH